MSAQDVTEQVAELFGRKQLSYEDFDRNMSEISCCYDKDSDFVDMVLQCFGVQESDPAEAAEAVGATTAPFSMEARAQLAVERRRQAEEERKARLLDPKARMIGIDVDALNRQVEEKRKAAAAEQEKDVESDKQALLV